MKRVVYIFICLVLTACMGSGISEEDLLRNINSTPMVYTVECMAQTCVVERSDLFSSLLGQRTAIIPVEANIKAGIDLSKVNNVRIAEGKAYITLIHVKLLPLIRYAERGDIGFIKFRRGEAFIVGFRKNPEVH